MLRLSWGFAYHLRSSSKIIREEEWRGVNPNVPVSYGNPVETFELHKDEKNLACDICLRVATQQLSLVKSTFSGEFIRNRLKL